MQPVHGFLAMKANLVSTSLSMGNGFCLYFYAAAALSDRLLISHAIPADWAELSVLFSLRLTWNLFQAGSAEEKAHAIQEGAQRVLKTVDWLRKHRFMPPTQLKEWQHMVKLRLASLSVARLKSA